MPSTTPRRYRADHSLIRVRAHQWALRSRFPAHPSILPLVCCATAHRLPAGWDLSLDLPNSSISVHPSAPQITAVIAMIRISISRCRRLLPSRVSSRIEKFSISALGVSESMQRPRQGGCSHRILDSAPQIVRPQGLVRNLSALVYEDTKPRRISVCCCDSPGGSAISVGWQMAERPAGIRPTAEAVKLGSWRAMGAIRLRAGPISLPSVCWNGASICSSDRSTCCAKRCGAPGGERPIAIDTWVVLPEHLQQSDRRADSATADHGHASARVSDTAPREPDLSAARARAFRAIRFGLIHD
jgi:hypothetical protein